MALLRLTQHREGHGDEDLVFNSRDLPQAKLGDVVEVFHPDDLDISHSRLLLPVKVVRDDCPRESVSITNNLVKRFLNGFDMFENILYQLFSNGSTVISNINLSI